MFAASFHRILWKCYTILPQSPCQWASYHTLTPIQAFFSKLIPFRETSALWQGLFAFRSIEQDQL